ncbi:MAG: hypothetical protein CVT75_10730 [Alphaproteobacteria bacterium HGW-Alphaproteobacteria-14]|nr:MAG: hypothetical protein CVT75_10730 [Alphaproteobacteria bacterium HGW-Alphaproteobacteria-14]
MVRHVVLTGGPGAGKSTLLREAARAGLTTSPEVARRLLKQPGGMALRENDPTGFANAMMAAHLAEYERLQEVQAPVVFDRGFPDVVGFLEVSGLAVPDEIGKVCRTVRYQGLVLRAPAWREIYRPDSERTQDWDQAVASDRAVTAAWRHYGYVVEDLPLTNVWELYT